MKLPTIFSQTSLGQAQQWEIEVEGDKYRTHEGMVGGTITVTAWTTAKPKNVGRGNETTAEQQALAEAQSKHKKKLDAGGHLFIEDIAIEKFFEPMTAKKWKDCEKDVVYPAMCQPKLDGMRCTVGPISMTSRGGKPIPAAPHILEQLREVFDLFPDATLDGELYNHELKHDFDAIISLARKQKPTVRQLAECAEKLEYHIYDVQLAGTPDLPFFERIKVLTRMFQFLHASGKAKNIKLVETFTAPTLDVLNQYHDTWIGEGYEGQMVRDPNSKYEKKRSKALLKRKMFVDEEFVLVDVHPGQGNAEGYAASATLAMEDGRTFDAGIIGNRTYAADLLTNKVQYIGQKGTVVYQNLTPDGIPRIGKLKIIRNYE